MKNRKRMIFLIVIIICFIDHYIFETIAKGETTVNGYQYFYDNNHELIFCTEVTDDGTIMFYGKHNISNAEITYHTVGFNLSLDINNRLNPNLVSNKIFVERKEKENTGILSDPDYTLDVYYLTCDDVVPALMSLLKSSGLTSKQCYQRISEGVTVYFSNVFEVIERGGARIGTQVYSSYDDIIKAPQELKGVSWSGATQEILKNYYFNPITIKLTPYTYDVVYVDSNQIGTNPSDYQRLEMVEEGNPVLFGQQAVYKMSDESDIIIGNGIYAYNSSKYVYSSGKMNTKSLPYLNEGIISCEHGRRDDAVLYVFLDKIGETDDPETQDPTPIPEKNENSDVSISYFTPEASGGFAADDIGSEQFDVTVGIPSTETMYGFIQAKEYLLRIQYKNVSGTVNVPYSVTKTYRLIESDGTRRKQTVTQYGSAQRSYGYTEITGIDYYKIKDGTLTNEMLSDVVNVNPNGYSVPELSFQHYNGTSTHLSIPTNNNFRLSDEVVYNEIPEENLTSHVSHRVDSPKVRNDYLNFNGRVVLSSTWSYGMASAFQIGMIQPPGVISKTQMYCSGIQVPATVLNLVYDSAGTVTYEKVEGYNSELPDTLTYSLTNVNSVKVHTPIYCEAKISQDNDQYVQLAAPDLSSVPLVVDESSITGDFLLMVSNTGYHSSKKGYGNRDYEKYTASINGTVRNQVCFPISMYLDTGNDYSTENDILLKANQWYTIGTQNQRFYIPMWVKEGSYEAVVRTVAVNAGNRTNAYQKQKNTETIYYTVQDRFTLQISGRMYGLTMYDVADYPLWQEAFYEDGALKRNNRSLLSSYGVTLTRYEKDLVYDYMVGTRDSYGHDTGRQNKYTIPLVAGDHPQYKNQGFLTKGYEARFLLHTTGDVMAHQNAKILIQPRFYHVDERGKNRIEVDLYYKSATEAKKYPLVKVSGGYDLSQSISYSASDSHLGISGDMLSLTAKLLGIDKTKFMTEKHVMYQYSRIESGIPFKVFSNKAVDPNVSEEVMAACKQTYYFSYSLPAGCHATKKGTNVADYAKKYGITYQEDFWEQDGYLIVNFDLLAYDQAGNLRYSYINKDNYLSYGHCSMWIMEGGMPQKTDCNGTVFTLKAGDALLYPMNQDAVNDIVSDGIY